MVSRYAMRTILATQTLHLQSASWCLDNGVEDLQGSEQENKGEQHPLLSRKVELPNLELRNAQDDDVQGNVDDRHGKPE
jgi:hypothetical protein